MTSTKTWVQQKTELYEGELIVFKRANSPNWYMRVYVKKEGKHYQKSLKTKNHYTAIEKAKVEYKYLQQKVSKDEKVFTITLYEGIEGYKQYEVIRERRGMIKSDWLNKKYTFLKNIFYPHFDPDIKVNAISNEMIEKFVDKRLKAVKRRTTVQQEIMIIKHFYTTYLIKKGFVFKTPDFPAFKINRKDRARREDTFSLKEWDILVKYMRKWSNPKNISNIKKPVWKYGKRDNEEKVMKQWMYNMEVHRRILIRELILIAGNSGLRCPSEILSIKWGDIRVKRQVLDGIINPNIEKEQLVSIIEIGENTKTGARSVVCLAGSYFKRLKEYFREECFYEPKDDDPVFMEFYGRRKFDVLDRYAFYRMWEDLMRDAGLTRMNFTPYCLRGFYITNSILNGIDLMMISKNCGNSPSTISKFYEFINMEAQTETLTKRRDTRKEIANEVIL